MDEMTVVRTERGWIGHYICGADCLFRRNTLLECGSVRVVISTVGSLKRKESDEIETVGHNRYYETMAFHAKKDFGIYWDANVRRVVSFNSQWRIDDLSEKTDLLANDMHEAVIVEISTKLSAGKLTNKREPQ